MAVRVPHSSAFTVARLGLDEYAFPREQRDSLLDLFQFRFQFRLCLLARDRLDAKRKARDLIENLLVIC